MKFTYGYLLNSLSGWNLTGYPPNFDLRFAEAISSCDFSNFHYLSVESTFLHFSVVDDMG